MPIKILKPGEISPFSGEVDIVGPRGGDTHEDRTVVRGKPLPPTPEAGQQYRVRVRARNNAGQGR